MKILAIMPDESDPPGETLEACAARHGVAVESRIPPDGDEMPPDDSDYLGLIVLGGPQSAYNRDTDPFLQDTGRLIHRFHGAGKPVLGICLGAQIIAAAFGARCYEGAEPERGFHRVYPTAAAADDPLLPPIPGAGLRLLQFHRDSFELPDGAVRLMRGETYENQAFRLGDATYGFQPHIEATTDSLDAWLHSGPGIGYRERIPETWAEIDAETHLCDEVHRPLTLAFGDGWFGLAVRRAER